jgi:hypothetical protein
MRFCPPRPEGQGYVENRSQALPGLGGASKLCRAVEGLSNDFNLACRLQVGEIGTTIFSPSLPPAWRGRRLTLFRVIRGIKKLLPNERDGPSATASLGYDE